MFANTYYALGSTAELPWKQPVRKTCDSWVPLFDSLCLCGKEKTASLAVFVACFSEDYVAYFSQLKAAEGAQYSTEQAIKLEMELVELKAERTVMSLRVRKASANRIDF